MFIRNMRTHIVDGQCGISLYLIDCNVTIIIVGKSLMFDHNVIRVSLNLGNWWYICEND